MSLDFTINLGGNFVGALEKSAKGLDETGKEAHKAEKALELFEGELGKVRVGAAGINFNALFEGGHFFTFDLAEGAALAFEAVHKVVEAVADLGKEMIKAAGDAEDLNLAIKLDVGEEGFEKVDKLAESFKGSRFSPKLIKQSLLPILEESGDEHSDQWDDLVTAATDVATRRNTGSAGAKSALDALRSIEIMPQKIRGSLKELGIKQKDFYSDLGDLLGISEAAAAKQVKAGKVKADTLLSVALHQIAEREGGALGNATNQGAKTLGSTLERLGNLKENLFEGLADSPGMHAVQGFLDNFINTMEGPIGKELIGKISDGFETLFGDLSGPDGLAKMEKVIGSIAGKSEDFVEAFRGAWPEIKEDFEAAIPVFESLARTLGAIVKVIGALPKFGEWIGDQAFELLHPNFQQNGETTAIGKKAQAGLSDVAFSPGVPKFASGGIVNGPTLALIGEDGPEAVVPLGRSYGAMPDSSAQAGGFGAPSITYAPSFTFSGGSSEVREQIEEYEQQHRVSFKQFLDEAVEALGG